MNAWSRLERPTYEDIYREGQDLADELRTAEEDNDRLRGENAALRQRLAAYEGERRAA